MEKESFKRIKDQVTTGCYSVRDNGPMSHFHTDINNQGPPLSCLCFYFYLTHWKGRAGILPCLCVITHSGPTLWIQIFIGMMMTASALMCVMLSLITYVHLSGAGCCGLVAKPIFLFLFLCVLKAWGSLTIFVHLILIIRVIYYLYCIYLSMSRDR